MLITSIQLSLIHPETILEKPSSSDMIVSNRGDFSKMVSEWIFCSPNFAEKVIAFENLIFFIEILLFTIIPLFYPQWNVHFKTIELCLIRLIDLDFKSINCRNILISLKIDSLFFWVLLEGLGAVLYQRSRR